MTMPIYNENQYRDYPFKELPRPTGNVLNVPRDWIVDMGVTLPEDAGGFVPRTWYLERVLRSGNDITVQFVSDTAYSDFYPRLIFKYTLPLPEFSTIRLWTLYTGSAWLAPDNVFNTPVNYEVHNDVRYPARHQLLPNATFTKTSVQAYITFGNPDAITQVITASGPGVGEADFRGSTNPWQLEPCQVTDFQNLTITGFQTLAWSDEDPKIPFETWDPTVTPTYWDTGTYTKNADGSVGGIVTATDQTPRVDPPPYAYSTNGDIRWTSSTVMISPTDGSNWLSNLYMGPVFSTNGCELITNNVENTLIFNAGRYRPATLACGAGTAIRLFGYNEFLLANKRLEAGNSRTLLPGIPCNNLIYTINGLTGPDIPVTVGPGLIKTSNGDGHLKISLDLSNPKVRSSIGS